MTKTTGTWLLLFALIVAPMLIWWSTQEAPARATVAATTVPPARTSAPAQVRAQPVSTLDREAIAQDLRAIDRIARARKQRGKDDPVVNDLIYITSVSCAQYEAVAGKVSVPPGFVPTLATVRNDPMRAWAYDYLEQACEGFDSQEQLKHWRPTVSDVGVARQQFDEATAMTIALDDLHNAESSLQLSVAMSYLEGRPENPLRTRIPRDDGMAWAAMREFAMTPVRCKGLEMCGTHNVFVASLCLTEGCAPGTTLESYWRNKLTPSQVTLAVQLRDELARYRNTPAR